MFDRFMKIATGTAIALLMAVPFTLSQLTAANLPLITGPQDPSQLNATINTLIQSINSGVGGLLNAQTAIVATGVGTSEQTLQTYTLPANTITAAGQGVRTTCWGGTAANANNKTRKLYFGASAITTATEAANAQTWRLSFIVMRTAAATQQFLGSGEAGTASVTPLATVVLSGTDDFTAGAGIVIKCTATDGTSSAGDVSANGMITELIK